jgi:hypothetical protein
MGYACSWGERDNACIHSFEETLENVRLEDQDGEGMLILRWLLRWWAVRMELAEDHIQSRVLVLAMSNLFLVLLQCNQSVGFLVSSSVTWSVGQSVSQSCSNSELKLWALMLILLLEIRIHSCKNWLVLRVYGLPRFFLSSNATCGICFKADTHSECSTS